MQRIITGYILLLAFGLGLNHYFTNVYPPKPDEFLRQDGKLVLEQEKLNSAKILASELDRVEALIQNNLASSKNDPLAQDASVDFLNYMLEVLDELGCEITLMKTHTKDKSANYVRTPYEVGFKGTYKKFGRFINRIEKSDRLVQLELFKVDNDLTRLNFARSLEDLKEHEFVVKLSTMTLVRGASTASTRGRR